MNRTPSRPRTTTTQSQLPNWKWLRRHAGLDAIADTFVTLGNEHPAPVDKLRGFLRHVIVGPRVSSVRISGQLWQNATSWSRQLRSSRAISTSAKAMQAAHDPLRSTRCQSLVHRGWFGRDRTEVTGTNRAA